jgi:putative transposase
MATTLATPLVLDAFNMAFAMRRPKGTIRHSNQGTPPSDRCREAAVRPSKGSVGEACNNGMCESFFATLECELLARRRCQAARKRAVLDRRCA